MYVSWKFKNLPMSVIFSIFNLHFLSWYYTWNAETWQGICMDGTVCRNKKCCPTRPDRTRFSCCGIGVRAICCRDYRTCCPLGYLCNIQRHLCIRPGYSSVLRVQSMPLVNSTDKGCHDDTAGIELGMDILSQPAEQASKRRGLIGTSGDVFSPDEKYQCPDGTTICELSSGIYGCCPIENAR